MPIYEFFCDDCQKKFDVLCSMSADLSAISCEYCDGKHVMKKVSGFAVVGASRGESETFSGSGGHGCGSCSSGGCGTCSH